MSLAEISLLLRAASRSQARRALLLSEAIYAATAATTGMVKQGGQRLKTFRAEMRKSLE